MSVPTRVQVNKDHVLAWYPGLPDPVRMGLMEGADLIEQQMYDSVEARLPQTSASTSADMRAMVLIIVGALVAGSLIAGALALWVLR